MKDTCRCWFQSLFFVYETPKIVHIKNAKIGICNRLVQLSIISYVVGWVLIANKGYQTRDNLIYSTTAKVKGNLLDKKHQTLFDEGDFVIPPQESNAFFVATSFLLTKNQTQRTCAESPKHEHICNNRTDCAAGRILEGGHGVQTGRCIRVDSNTKVCEIFGWCPVEDRTRTKRTHFDISNVTVLIKNNIKFPKFGVVRSNLAFTDHVCYYNASDPIKRYSCPIFKLGDVIKKAGVMIPKDLYHWGGVIAIVIEWNCNLDHGVDACIPKYRFARLDTLTKFGAGWNFRFAQHYVEAGVLKRRLMKVYGVRFNIIVKGVAGKFNVIPLLQNIGSGLAILSVATILCDIFVLYCLQDRAYYRRNKFKYVHGTENEDRITTDGITYGSCSSNDSNIAGKSI